MGRRLPYLVVVRRESNGAAGTANQGHTMYNAYVVKLYENGRRGRPVPHIRAGDLADPVGKSPWARVVSFLTGVVEVAREARRLESEMLGKSHFRRFG